MTDIITEHRLAVKRWGEAEPFTVEAVEAEAALVASFQRLNDRFSEVDQECAFHRVQAG